MMSGTKVARRVVRRMVQGGKTLTLMNTPSTAQQPPNDAGIDITHWIAFTKQSDGASGCWVQLTQRCGGVLEAVSVVWRL